jgi:3,4-dihydroxy 2-butanone 4-phosphate synthase/GTP cyclohydrolase II
MLPEAALDLCTLAGFRDAAVFCEVLNEHGDYASVAEGQELAAALQIPVFHLEEIVRHRLESESLVHRVAEAQFPCMYAGPSTSIAYRSIVYEGEHLAIVKGAINEGDEPILTRVHSENTFADVFGNGLNDTESGSPSSRKTIAASLRLIGQRGRGVFIYLRKQSAGQLSNEIKGPDPDQAIMMRSYGIGAQILRDLGVQKIELITNSKKNLAGLSPFGIEISSQRSLETVMD